MTNSAIDQKNQPRPRISGSQLLIKLLERQGVTHISGVPGGANLPMYDALTGSSIKHVLARHEQGAGFIAQGMARVSGKAQVCFASSGPGASNSAPKGSKVGPTASTYFCIESGSVTSFPAIRYAATGILLSMACRIGALRPFR